MDVKKLLIATVAVGVVANVYDSVVHGWILTSTYQGLPDLVRQDMSWAALVIGDFVAALVLVWVYARVYDSFGGGVAGGAKFGFYAGVLFSFPAYIFNHLIFVGFPYSLAWKWTIAGILWGVVAGATAGAVYKQESSALA